MVIPNALGEDLTPSVVGVDDDGTVLVGQAAKQRLVSHPETTVACFKRLMGSAKQVELSKRHKFSAIELSSLVLRSLKDDAERFLGHPVSRAVVSVPAYFNDNQRQATRDAAHLAGLEVNRLVNEPTGAAMAHGLHHSSEQRFIVLDLGGGTFDVSIIEYFDGVLEVHSTAGDSALGGEDFTEALVSHFLDQTDLDKHSLDATTRQRLYVRAETAKREYRQSQPSVISLDQGGKNYELTLDEARFKAACVSLLSRLREPMSRALRDANLKLEDLDDVVLVGGATRMPIFRNMVAKLFQRLPRADADPDMTIVHGAAIQAGLVEKDKSLDDIVLTDVCPFSLGIAVLDAVNPADGRLVFSPILERNTIVPSSKVQRFYTVADDQPKISVQIYQGESRWVNNNLLLEDFNVKVPRKRAGEEAVDVRFSYDVNGLLDVDVTVVSTDKKTNRLIESQVGRLTKEQKSASLKKLDRLKVLPRDKEEVRVLLARADRIFGSLLDEDRQRLSLAISQFESILNRQNKAEISKACKDFAEFLDQADRDIWS